MSVSIIACYRTTNLLSPDLIKAWMAAEQVAIDRDFAPVWGGAQLVFVDVGESFPPGSWPMVFQDTSAVADALGYHELYARGIPSLVIAVKECLDGKYNWNVTASHEVKETIVDPLDNQTVVVGSTEYAKEICDAVEDDSLAYAVDGHLTSNFVLPSYFVANSQGPWDFRGVLTAPLSVSEGGYVPERPINGAWTQVFGRNPSQRALVKAPISRTARRFNSQTIAEMPGGL